MHKRQSKFFATKYCAQFYRNWVCVGVLTHVAWLQLCLYVFPSKFCLGHLDAFCVEKSYDFLLEPSDSQGFDQMLRKCSWCHRFWNCLKWSFRMLDLFNFACVVFWYMYKFCWGHLDKFCIENFYDFLHEPWLVTIDWIRMLRNCAWWHHSWNFLYWSFSSLSWLFVVIDCCG